MKELYADGDVLTRTLNASRTLSKHVGSTMGPNGKNVIIKSLGYGTVVTQDGVTVARAMELPNAAENSVADIIKQAAIQLEDLVGDGTTTVTILINAILEESNKLIAAGYTPKQIVEGIESYGKKVAAYIKDATMEITKEMLEKVATISAKNEDIGKLVASVVYDLGASATITTQESPNWKDAVDTVAGFEIPFGWVSHYMAVNRKAEMENPYVIVCDMPLREKQDVFPLLQVLHQQENKQAVIFARQIGGDALSLLVINKLKKVVDVVAIEIVDGHIPASDIFADISVSTGAKILSRSNGRPVDGFKIEDAGTVGKAVIERDKSTLINVGGKKEAIQEYVKVLKTTKTSSPLEKEAIARRISCIEAKVANIHVGGKTPAEIQERMYRVDDAIGAAKTALKTGVVLGGGYVLYKASNLEPSNEQQALAKALRVPLKTIQANGTDEYTQEQLIQDGVFDPAGTLVECLRTAISTVTVLLLSGSMIMELEDENKASK